MKLNDKKIAIIGLGYVGLPLAVAFAEKYQVLGFDINEKRVNELKSGFDRTFEITQKDLLKALENSKNSEVGLKISSNNLDLSNYNIFIVTVPTPIDKNNNPDLTPLIKATENISNILKKNDIVIYESTVYPGVTEEKMVPILESISGLSYNLDFFCGYSPERINPGDKLHTVKNILKVTSGSTPEIAEVIDQLYKSVIEAGTFKASNIKVAEAAKVIENSQRDINIAFVNELSKIFTAMNIDTLEVLEAASTKWNFLNFKPGLVGGHCIGVDPYYLAQKAQEVGYHPEIILAGRRLNDSMGKYVASEVIRKMIKKEIKILNSKALILGFTFKENCPDVRNTKVIDIYNELKKFGVSVEVFDPHASADEIKIEYDITLQNENCINNLNNYSAIILAVSHDKFNNLKICKSDKLVVYDVKGILDKTFIDARL